MVAHDDYRPLVDALKTVLQEHGLPQYPSAFGRRVFTAGQEIAMEFYSRGLAEVVVEVLCAFPRVVERMSRAEAADPTEFNCPVCGKPVRRCNAVATPFGGAVCLPCANDKPPMPRLPELGK